MRSQFLLTAIIHLLFMNGMIQAGNRCTYLGKPFEFEVCLDLCDNPVFELNISNLYPVNHWRLHHCEGDGYREVASRGNCRKVTLDCPLKTKGVILKAHCGDTIGCTISKLIGIRLAATIAFRQHTAVFAYIGVPRERQKRWSNIHLKVKGIRSNHSFTPTCIDHRPLNAEELLSQQLLNDGRFEYYTCFVERLVHGEIYKFTVKFEANRVVGRVSATKQFNGLKRPLTPECSMSNTQGTREVTADVNVNLPSNSIQESIQIYCTSTHTPSCANNETKNVYPTATWPGQAKYKYTLYPGAILYVKVQTKSGQGNEQSDSIPWTSQPQYIAPHRVQLVRVELMQQDVDSQIARVNVKVTPHPETLQTHFKISHSSSHLNTTYTIFEMPKNVAVGEELTFLYLITPQPNKDLYQISVQSAVCIDSCDSTAEDAKVVFAQANSASVKITGLKQSTVTVISTTQTTSHNNLLAVGFTGLASGAIVLIVVGLALIYRSLKKKQRKKRTVASKGQTNQPTLGSPGQVWHPTVSTDLYPQSHGRRQGTQPDAEEDSSHFQKHSYAPRLFSEQLVKDPNIKTLSTSAMVSKQGKPRVLPQLPDIPGARNSQLPVAYQSRRRSSV